MQYILIILFFFPNSSQILLILYFLSLSFKKGKNLPTPPQLCVLYLSVSKKIHRNTETKIKTQTGYVHHTLRQAPCPGVVNQYKTNKLHLYCGIFVLF